MLYPCEDELDSGGFRGGGQILENVAKSCFQSFLGGPLGMIRNAFSHLHYGISNAFSHLHYGISNAFSHLHSKAVSFDLPNQLCWTITHTWSTMGLRGQMGQELKVCLFLERVWYCTSDPLKVVFNQTNAKGETFKSYELLLCLHYGNTMHSL